MISYDYYVAIFTWAVALLSKRLSLKQMTRMIMQCLSNRVSNALKRLFILYIIFIKYGIAYFSFIISCFLSGSPTPQVEVETTRHSHVCRTPYRKTRNRWGKDMQTG